jgi:glycosyltransferase involved in cell wall biosynthesis
MAPPLGGSCFGIQRDKPRKTRVDVRRAVTTLPRVLVVSPRLEIGGTEMHLTRVLPELRRRGLDVSAFVIARGGQLDGQLAGKGVPVSGPNGAIPRPFRSLVACILLRRQLRLLRPKIIHFFLPEPYLIGSLASAGLHGVVRIMSRRSLAVYQQNHFILARLERWLHRFSNALLGNSTAVVEELVAECGDRSKVGLIYNGIEIPPAVLPDQRLAVRREFGIPPDAFVLVVSANFIAYKGHGDLFDALGVMKDRFAGPWRLLLIGHDSGMGLVLRQKAMALGFADHIVWVEDRMNAQTPLAAADIAVVPSHQEGFSNSLLEVMACGLAVVATRVGGNIDAIIDGESGLLVPAKDAAALMAAIFRLYDDPVLRQRLGAAARSRVSKHFSLDNCVQRYLDLYTRVMDEVGRVQPTLQEASQVGP